MKNKLSKQIILVGMPASAKSRVGREIAKLNYNTLLIDLDIAIANSEQKTISEIFDSVSEQGFRAIETKVLKDVLNGNYTDYIDNYESSNEEKLIVISLGGGAIANEYTAASNQASIDDARLGGALVVYLDVDYAVAKNRITKPERLATRPLFAKNGVEYWQELLEKRHGSYYNHCDLRIRTGFSDGNYIDASIIAKQIIDASKLQIIRLIEQRTNKINCNITIGKDAYKQVASFISNQNPNIKPKVAILHTKSVENYASNIANVLYNQEIESIKYEIADAEEGKTFTEYEKCLEFLAENKFTRTDFIVAVGGGALTDISGFIAASFLRGINYINIPTSLLAMVDASVGGKTAINLRSGKNLCGAFWQPKAVYLDPQFLLTLGKRELIEGFGEIVKMGLVFDADILQIIDKIDIDNLFDILTHQNCEDDEIYSTALDTLTELIYLCVKAKADVVSKDLHDNGLREFLNYGHTFGHIVEKYENYQLRHGEAVSIGVIFAAELAFELGMISKELVEEHYKYLQKCGLPVSWKPSNTDITYQQIVDDFTNDKKTQGNNLRFVLLKGEQKPVIITNPPASKVINALEKVMQK